MKIVYVLTADQCSGCKQITGDWKVAYLGKDEVGEADWKPFCSYCHLRASMRDFKPLTEEDLDKPAIIQQLGTDVENVYNWRQVLDYDAEHGHMKLMEWELRPNPRDGSKEQE